MTVEELIAELQDLPGASAQAIVWVNQRTEFTIDYSHGHVVIKTADVKKDW